MVTRAGISSSGAGCLDSLSWWETCSNLISFLAFLGYFKTHWFVHRFTVTTDYYWPSHFSGTQWLVSYPNAANSWWTMGCFPVPFSCGYVSDCGDPTSHQIRSSVFICWKTIISWHYLTYFTPNHGFHHAMYAFSLMVPFNQLRNFTMTSPVFEVMFCLETRKMPSPKHFGRPAN